jgi:UDP-N-acetylmuramate: L-alanyl-gamma-D-glutamyl-meso-diaminopimelate ligase
MKIHMVAICGTGMGALAGLLKEAGHEVRGSDKAFYPPMSESLRAWGISMLKGFDAAHIEPGTDLVVVGNACRKDNPEVQAALSSGMQVMSFPQALAEMFIKQKRSLVVAGTHGKTTTAALLAFGLTQAKRDPSFLIGGIPLNFGKSFREGASDLFVVEGDEYDTAFFDKRPKFIHYRPQVVLLTSLEYDHADIYPSLDAYRAAFQSLIALLPPNGLLIACEDYPEVRALARQAPCPVISYGLNPGHDYSAAEIQIEHAASSFNLISKGKYRARLSVPLAGRHNVANTLAVLVVMDHLGIPAQETAGLLSNFTGVARRMQVRGAEDGVTVIDDFAHHPSKVRETVAAVRARYPRAHFVAVFEPRTNSSRRKVFQNDYPASFAGADRVVIALPYEMDKIPESERFDSARLVRDLQIRGLKAQLTPNANAAVKELASSLPRGAVVLVMSNGDFDGIHEKLLTALRNRGGVVGQSTGGEVLVE